MTALVAAALGVMSGTALAQEVVKIGLILPMTGPFASTGRQIDAAVKLYIAQNGATVGGRKIEVILKDDTGVAGIRGWLLPGHCSGRQFEPPVGRRHVRAGAARRNKCKHQRSMPQKPPCVRNHNLPHGVAASSPFSFLLD